MKPRSALASAAVLVAVAAGAALVCGPVPDGQELHEGVYTTGFEVSALAPCAERFRGEQWWLAADSAAWSALNRRDDLPPDRRADHEYVSRLVRVRGTITDTGSYGHVGAYDRRIRVTEALWMSPPDSAACPEGRSGG